MQADTARARPKSRVALSLMLVLLLVAAVAPLSPARAHNHQPWDQPGSAWQGSIETVSHRKSDSSNPEQGYVSYDPRGTYTNLVPMNSSANGGYSADIQTSGTAEWVGYCSLTGGPRDSVLTSTWNGAASADPSIPAIILETDDEGRTYFTPWYGVTMPMADVTSTCGQGSDQVDPGSTMLTFALAPGDPLMADNPLPDSDPDPLHLVGERTWTIGDWPATPSLEWEEYTFTVTYDLRLVIDDCVDNNVIHDIYEAGPEFAEFELRTNWCVTKAGDVRVTDASAEGRLLHVGALEAVIREEYKTFFNLRTEWRPSKVDITPDGGTAVIRGTGRLKECFGIPLPLKTKYLRKLSDVFLEISVKAKNQAVRRAAIIVADLLDKAANKLSQGSRWLARRVLNTVLDVLATLPLRVSDKLLDLIIFIGGSWENSAQLAKDFVKKGIIAKDIAITKVLKNEYCLMAWKPRIVQSIHGDGTAVSGYVDLEGDYPWEPPVRTGGSA